MARKTDYYDPFGQKQTGYIINGQTYKDEAGTQRIDNGSAVTVGGKTYQMTDNGGVQVNPGVLPQANSAPVWLQEAQSILQEINSGKKSTIDIASDPLYQQYQQIMQANAKRAMEDTMGQAAGLTGGYGSSYAQGVGQQAYNEEMRQLGDKALDIYQLRANEQAADRADLYNRLSAAQGMYDRAYAVEQDKLSEDWRQRQWDAEQAQQQIENDWRQTQWDYNVMQDTLDRAWDMINWSLQYGVDPSDADLQNAGITRDQFNKAREYIAYQQSARSGGSGYMQTPAAETTEEAGTPVPANVLQQLANAYTASGGKISSIKSSMAELQNNGYDTDAAYDYILSFFKKSGKTQQQSTSKTKNTRQVQ